MSNAATTIAGKKLVEIEHMGSAMQIELRPLSIRKLLEFCQNVLAEKRFELVVLCTEKPAEFIDGLSPEAFGKLYSEALALNFAKATPMILADPTLAGAMLPLVRRMQNAAMQIISEIGFDSSPAPLPSGSAVATGSESLTYPPTASSPSSAPAQS